MSKIIIKNENRAEHINILDNIVHSSSKEERQHFIDGMKTFVKCDTYDGYVDFDNIVDFVFLKLTHDYVNRDDDNEDAPSYYDVRGLVALISTINKDLLTTDI